MIDIQVFPFEGREIKYTFRPATVPSAPLLVLLHGHTTTPRPSKFRDPRWNVLCPIDDFGVQGYGSWYLGEGGDFFWVRAMPALIKHVHSGDNIFFAGSSMGGYGSILHGSLIGAYGVYANVAQTLLLGSTYSEGGMKKFFEPIFEQGKVHEYNDLRNILTHRLPTTFIISSYRFDKVNYIEEQTFSFINKLLKKDINFSTEIRLGKGHALTHSFAEVSEIFIENMKTIEENYEKLKVNHVNTRSC